MLEKLIEGRHTHDFRLDVALFEPLLWAKVSNV